tara:strand:- start:175 stop:1017 length:843 start_codon:yes stop_codon:yes gene_type:complete
MKLKHSKYKNTGILFELLTRQLTAETISGTSNKSLNFIKKHFNTNKELLKEYQIYRTFLNQKYKKESQAAMLIESLLEEHKKLNKSQLRREKYNLIKEIKDTYNVNNFFNAKINNYKVMASIFNLLENKNFSPKLIVKSKTTLLEHIIETPKISTKNSLIENYKKQDKDTKLITYKLILEKFNNKYKDLSLNQKTLLKEYVNNVSNSPSFKLYINEEIKKVKKDLIKYSNIVKDKVISIKLNETKDLIHPITKKSSVQDDNVTNLLNYYELINELKEIHG